jgi:putative spermidine/putrescine transport system ATP-binding protein
MSDRLAVFADGRLEQVGSPAEVYEHPRSAFVARFVGTSNVIDSALAERLRGSSHPFTVRPEKISLISPDGTPGEEVRAVGTIRSAVYLGERTRYTVDLDGGGQLIAVEQNRAASEGDARTQPGRPVRVAWHRQFDQLLPDDDQPPEARGENA